MVVKREDGRNGKVYFLDYPESNLFGYRYTLMHAPAWKVKRNAGRIKRTLQHAKEQGF